MTRQDVADRASEAHELGPGRCRALFRPVDSAGLAYFRIVFGGIMLWEVYRYFEHGWIKLYWIDPPFHFKYYGFEWVRPLPGDGMYWLFAGLGVLSALLVVGLCYRLCAVLFFLGFTYMFLLEQARFLNHFYLISLLAFLMPFLPLHRTCSLDAWLRPGIAARSVPAWSLWLLRFQIGVPYFFGGVAKLNADWLRAEPMRGWLANMTDFPLIGRWFTQEWMVYGFSYGGLLFDLFIVPALLWRRTRPFAFALAVCFHVLNDNLFSIGIFPWFMIAASVIYFEPDWPRRLLARIPGLSPSATHATDVPPPARWPRATLALLALWCALQGAIPMRHLLYPGNPSWTEEGHRFAWHMKLRGKNGSARFFIEDRDSGQRWTVDPRRRMPRYQERKMIAHPDMILQYAHFLAEEKRRQGHPNVSVRASVLMSLNGRPRQHLIDRNVDLSRVERTLWPAPWILPLTTPLPRYE